MGFFEMFKSKPTEEEVLAERKKKAEAFEAEQTDAESPNVTEFEIDVTDPNASPVEEMKTIDYVVPVKNEPEPPVLTDDMVVDDGHKATYKVDGLEDPQPAGWDQVTLDSDDKRVLKQNEQEAA